MEVWTKALDTGTPTDIIYTDFSKAFDKVSHNKLFFKLQSLGIKGNLLQGIKDFLTNRRQRVRVHHEFSNWEVVSRSVPQGSVLGAILFVCFINDLPMAWGRLFADDAKIGTEVKNKFDDQNLQANLNDALNDTMIDP